jgi:hypothetical protein
VLFGGFGSSLFFVVLYARVTVVSGVSLFRLVLFAKFFLDSFKFFLDSFILV